RKAPPPRCRSCTTSKPTLRWPGYGRREGGSNRDSPSVVGGNAHTRGDRVATAAHRHQALRIPRIPLDLAPEVRDVDARAPLAAAVRPRPRVPKDPAPGEDPFGLRARGRDQPKLGPGQGDGLPGDRARVAREVDPDVPALPDAARRQSVELAPPQ